MTAWIVRGGDPTDEEEALENGVLALGYGLKHDLSELRTMEDISLLLRQTRPDVEDGSISSWAGQIWNFKENIQVGDLVVMPRKGRDTVSIGEMSGEYYFLPDASHLFHARSVSWINREVPRNSLAPDLQNSMNSSGTVRRPGRPDSETLLRDAAETSRGSGTRRGGGGSLWDEFVRRAQGYVTSGRLESEEIDYKLVIGQKLAEAREAALSGADGWGSLVKSGMAGNLIHPIEQSKFRHWIDDSPDEARLALQALWAGVEAPVDKRIRNFCDLLPRPVSSGPGTRTTAVSVLLMGLDVEQYPPYRVTVFNEAYMRTGYAEPGLGADEAELYKHSLGFLDRFIEEASARGLSLRHRLDAQSLVWAILRAGEDEGPIDGDTPPSPPSSEEPWSPTNIAALAGDLLWKPEQLQEIVDDLKEKRQVIFYGPPGTGKTYVARAIAQQCRLNGGDFEIVQFHPSYSYEDFVEGFRPKQNDGQPGFDLVSGPLLRIAEEARRNSEATFILVIDELNRGNVAKVFGELYFLLEYRDEDVRLQYSAGRAGFSLPSNLWFICTMNTADRSIALMDAALRRRFYFAPFFPDEPPIKGLLRRWLIREGQDTRAADLVDAANAKLERDMGIGPSYFMGGGGALDQPRVERIWKRSVLPYIEEQFFGDSAKLAEFDISRLTRQLAGAATDGLETVAEFKDDTATVQANNDDTDPS